MADRYYANRKDIADGIRDYRREEEYRRRQQANMDDFRSGVAQAPFATAGLAAGAVVGAGGLGVAASRSLRFRYILQAVLHFPFAIIVSYVVFVAIFSQTMMRSQPTDESLLIMVVVPLLLSLVVGSIWSVIYILVRTRRKLARLDQEEQAAHYAQQGKYGQHWH